MKLHFLIVALSLTALAAPSAWAADCSTGYKGYNCTNGVWVETNEANDAPCPASCPMATLEETGLTCNATTGDFHTNTLCSTNTGPVNSPSVPEMSDLLVPAFIIVAGGIVFMLRRRRA